MCRPCQAKKSSAWRKKKKHTDPAGFRQADRATKLKTKFGLSILEFEQMEVDQDGRCYLCGKSPDNNKPLFVDHDHKTGIVRRLLCFKCNLALGLVQEDITVLKAMVRYILEFTP